MVTESNPRLAMIRWLCATLLLSACSGSDEGRPPPGDSFFYPTGVVVDPLGRWAYVTNGNTDLRFNGGSVVALDLQKALQLFKDGKCTRFDPIDNRIPVCDEKQIIDASKTVLVGNFPGQPAIQRFLKSTGAGTQRGTMAACDPATGDDPSCVPELVPDYSQANGAYRILLPVRGDPSLTWINVLPDGSMNCNQGAGPVGRCAGDHRLTTLLTNPEVVYHPEPFGIAVSDEMGVAMTSHLTSATVSLIDLSDRPETTPQFVNVLTGIFDPNQQGGRAAYGIALRRIDPMLLPPTCGGLPTCTMGDYNLFFATSRISPRLAQLLARGADLCRPNLPGDPCASIRDKMTLVESTQVRLDLYLADGSDVRDIKFSKDGTRAYVVDRQPPSVLVIDTSPIPPPLGDPRSVVLRGIEVCPQPSLLALREDPGPLRVYVTCFAAGEIFVVDPLRADVVDVIEVGRGPNSVQIFNNSEFGTLGIVANFADNDIAVVSLEPGTADENTVLFKIGMPSPTVQH